MESLYHMMSANLCPNVRYFTFGDVTRQRKMTCKKTGIGKKIIDDLISNPGKCPSRNNKRKILKVLHKFNPLMTFGINKKGNYIGMYFIHSKYTY